MNYYYKLTTETYSINSIIDTKDQVNNSRVVQNNRLKSVFETAYKLSDKYDIAIYEVLCNNTPFLNITSINLFRRINYIVLIYLLKFKMKINRYFSYSDMCYFIDFILEKARIQVQKETNISLPNRFNSSFFFSSFNECKSYAEKFDQNNIYYIIKVELIETRSIDYFDNLLISDFNSCKTSSNYIDIAKKFLRKQKSDNPQIETVFQGKFKILSITCIS